VKQTSAISTNKESLLHEQDILSAYHINAQAWSNIVARNGIPSRVLVTNSAILSAIEEYNPATLLDLGCGEGWLARGVALGGRRVFGVDGVEELIVSAREQSSPEIHYAQYDYQAIAEGALNIWSAVENVRFDLVVCNFAIIGQLWVAEALAKIPLSEHGHVMIQTLHPVVANGTEVYADGWREGSWAGFGSEFTKPAPWYFRTIASWIQLLRSAGLSLVELREPLHPETQKPASLVLIAERI
jgi:2-polyprenyl-3-methyl-5-hydroxy-6-metoxy-1,4-benzoquinol methylase